MDSISMLEVTVLKNLHGGESQSSAEIEAKKLLEHIRDCDVFSSEAACSLESEALHRERIWQEILRLDISRSKFSKWLEPRYQNYDPKMFPRYFYRC